MTHNPHSLLVLLALVVCGGCATAFQEAHYFRSERNGEGPANRNYYRVRVTGATALSSSRYVSGYFDPEAVDIYFNEIKQPDKGRIRPVKAQGESPPSGQTDDAQGTGVGVGAEHSAGGDRAPERPEAARRRPSRRHDRRRWG